MKWRNGQPIERNKNILTQTKTLKFFPFWTRDFSTEKKNVNETDKKHTMIAKHTFPYSGWYFRRQPNLQVKFSVKISSKHSAQMLMSFSKQIRHTADWWNAEMDAQKDQKMGPHLSFKIYERILLLLLLLFLSTHVLTIHDNDRFWFSCLWSDFAFGIQRLTSIWKLQIGIIKKERKKSYLIKCKETAYISIFNILGRKLHFLFISSHCDCASTSIQFCFDWP